MARPDPVGLLFGDLRRSQAHWRRWVRLRSVSSSLLMEHREKTHSGHALNLALCQRTPAATRQPAKRPNHQN
jgi:hypothetical protein